METFSCPMADFNSPFDFLNPKPYSKTSKRKQVSVSTNRRSTALPLSKSRPLHSRQNSLLRKSKSKCETEVNYESKKKSGSIETSKKTVKKKKLTDPSMAHSHNKLGSSKKEYEELEDRPRKKWDRKEMFHSTCFSRVIIPEPVPLSSLTYSSSKSLPKEKQLQLILNRTRKVLSCYRQKYEDMKVSCDFYRKQLQKATRNLYGNKSFSSIPKRKKKTKQTR